MRASELQINDEAMGPIVLGLALECHEFALASGIPSQSVDDQLPLVFGVLDRHLRDILNIRNVPAVGTSCLSGLRIGFSDEGYRLTAKAAKDRMANAVY